MECWRPDVREILDPPLLCVVLLEQEMSQHVERYVVA